jgi:hypothetical protein
MVDNRRAMPRKGCLNRPTLLAVARGQCPKERLPLVQRHLASCAFCRASVVAAASGIRGPGETVYMRRPRVADHRWPKRLAVAASLLAAGAAWLYGSPPEPPPAVTPPTASEGRAALKPAPPPARAAASSFSEPAPPTPHVGVSVLHSPPGDATGQSAP